MSDVVKDNARVDSQVQDESAAPITDVDNYVAYTLKSTKPLPPITWSNLYNEINWLSFYILTVPPLVGLVGLFTVKLHWATAVWAVVYYFMTGLGLYFFCNLNNDAHNSL